VDFRHSPLQWQTAYCFPDDPHKSLVDHRGSLLYGHPGRKNIEYFPTVVEFGLLGMEDNHVTRQEVEAPGVPIVHTRVERPSGRFELITFATNRPGEGRVDNVLLRTPARAVAILDVRTRGVLKVEGRQVSLDGKPLLTAHRPPRLIDAGNSWQLRFPLEQAGAEVLLRFPLQGQAVEASDGRRCWKRPGPGGRTGRRSPAAWSGIFPGRTWTF
jgi:hypothetical protein